jgi:hypothetical protein
MSWDDIPLLKYEAEVFIHAGAWINIEHLEESLILHELFLLYRACNHSLSQQIKGMALAQGAEGVDLEEDWYDTSAVADKRTMRMHDLPQFAATGLSLGYETSGQ